MQLVTFNFRKIKMELVARTGVTGLGLDNPMGQIT